jgi:uncharacterized membrane protein YgcG
VNSYAPATRKFIAAVWRRILVVRIVESIAVATAIAAAAGLALMPILWWRGQSGLPLAFAMLLLGASCGLIWGISRRPTRFGAAVEADRQLNLHDLLGTVYQLSRNAGATDDAWRNSIALVSDGRCRSLRPSAVVVNRLGLRAWGGIGVLGSLLLTLGLFTARPIEVTAASSPESNPLNAQQNIQPSIALANQASRRIARPPGPGGTDDISQRGFPEDRPVDSKGDSIARTRAARTNSVSNNGGSTGGGAAVSHQSAIPHQSAALQDFSENALHSTSGPIAAGAGQGESHANLPGDSAGTTAASNSRSHTPPWTASQWSGDSAAAQGAISAGQVPDTDADLVRDYFQRD